MNLPKPHLSFSQIDLWLRSPETYRRKYYGDVKFAQTPAMEFGNKVTLAMEAGEEWVSFIPHLPIFERELLVEIEGVPVLMFIDSSDENNAFFEQKTGKTRWSENKVKKHLQLPLYSLGLQIADGFVEDECNLIWVEAQAPVRHRGLGMKPKVTVDHYTLTGRFEKTPRIITQEERDQTRELVYRIGREIEEDFAAKKHFYQEQV